MRAEFEDPGCETLGPRMQGAAGEIKEPPKNVRGSIIEREITGKTGLDRERRARLLYD